MVVKRRILLYEAYETDEENFTPYIPNQGETEEENQENKEKTENNEEVEEDEENSAVEENEDGYTLHQGEILKKFYYGDIYSSDVTYDYKDIKNSGNLSMVYSEDNLKQLYLGVRCKISTEWIEKNRDDFNIKEMPLALLGFITGAEFSDYTHKLTLDGMDKLMDKKYEFNFTQMKISEIMAEVIKTAGLTPKINFEGLEDQVIDFSTTTKSENTDEEGADSGSVQVSTDMKTLAKRICKGIKDPVKKAKALWTWAHDQLNYSYYYNHRYCPAEVVSKGLGNCVDHAILLYHLGSAVGLKVGFINTTCMGYGHVYAGFVISGKVYTADASIKQGVKAFDQSWGSCPRVTTSNIRYDWSMWGSC